MRVRVQFSFPDACPIGVRRSTASATPSEKEAATFGNPRCGGIILNPDDSFILHEDDEILVVAEDDDTYRPTVSARPSAGSLPTWLPPHQDNENVLLLGWRRDLYDMLQELDKYVRRGCIVTVLAPVPVDDRQTMLEAGKAGPLTLRNIELHHVCGSTTYRRDIEAGMRAQAFSSALVLSSEGGGGHRGNDNAEDSRALTTLLLVRDIRQTLMRQAAWGATKNGDRAGADEAAVQPEDFTLLGEILDMETKDLVASAGVSDYIMSNRLMSKVMAMVAEEDSIGPLFEQLFAEEGDEIYVRDVRCYCRIGERLSFWELGARARLRGDIVLGYKRGGAEVILNPAQKTEPISWEEGDFLIVIGDDGESSA